MLTSVSTSLVPLYCAPPQKPLSNSLCLCVILRENCHFLFQSTYFESGVWNTCRLLFCPVSPSRGQVRSQELFSGGKRNLKYFTLRHVLAGCGPYIMDLSFSCRGCLQCLNAPMAPWCFRFLTYSARCNISLLVG